MTSEVSQRLKEINVDPKTVTLPKMMTSTSEVPKPAVDLRPGTHNYKASIALGRTTNSAHHEDGDQGRKWSMDCH